MGEKQNNVSQARIAIEQFKIVDDEGQTHVYKGNANEEIEATDKRAIHHIVQNEKTKEQDFNSIFEESFI